LRYVLKIMSTRRRYKKPELFTTVVENKRQGKGRQSELLAKAFSTVI